MPPRDKRMEHVRKSMQHSVKRFSRAPEAGRDVHCPRLGAEGGHRVQHTHGHAPGGPPGCSALAAGRAGAEVGEQARGRADRSRALASEWQDIRADFIDAHLGDSTIETFKSELRALRLGSGEDDCKTPSELNTQFDRLAELAYPMALGAAGRRADLRWRRCWATSTARIVAGQQPLYLWKNIQRRCRADHVGRVEGGAGQTLGC